MGYSAFDFKNNSDKELFDMSKTFSKFIARQMNKFLIQFDL